MAEKIEKVQPDTGELRVGDFVSQANQKVQLDIDDAPFLVEPEVNLPEETSSKEVKQTQEEQSPPPDNRHRNRLIAVISGCVLGLVVVVGAGVWYFVSSPPLEKPLAEPTVIVVPSKKSLTGPTEYKIEFAPFMVEQRENGSVQFLQVRFTGVARDEKTVAEAKFKNLLLRDAIYFYLKNRSLEYLTNTANTQTIKQELFDIVNSNLNQGKLEDILLVNYVMK